MRLVLSFCSRQASPAWSGLALAPLRPLLAALALGHLALAFAAFDVFVLAGVLRETTDRPGPDVATRDDCRRWSAYLIHLLSVAAIPTAATSRPEPIVNVAA